MKLKEIIIVDDHRLFRSGLKYLLESTGKYRVSGEATNGMELLSLLDTLMPDLIIMDINMPMMNGIDATRQVLKKFPGLKILIVSMHGQSEYYNALLDCGIKGFLLKDTDNEEFFVAINKILSGETYFAQEVLLSMIHDNSNQPFKISQREKQILDLISQGLSNQEIAGTLKISQRTVERHRTNLLEKTGSKNSIRLVIYALKNNLINIE
jgi:DNA-binding NarL/FixJ family response regulator